MKVVIRVDSSFIIGTGHVQRCLALANGLRKKSNAQVLFVCRRYSGASIDNILKEGFELILMKDSVKNTQGHHFHSHWLGASENQDALEFIDLLRFFGVNDINYIVTDHYGIGETWHKAVDKIADKIIAIDDLGDRKHYADYLIDQTIECTTKKYTNLVPPHCRLYLGTRYALLREEFHNKDKVDIYQYRARKVSIDSILVMLGGTDPENVCRIVLEQLAKNASIHTVNVIANTNAQHKEDIQRYCQNKKKLNFFESPTNIAQLMRQNDLAVGAAGTTSWERCSQGLPGVVIVQAQNQLGVAKNLQSLGIATVLSVDEIAGKLNQEIAYWRSCKNRYHRAISKSLSLCDGLGVQRIINTVFNNPG